MRWSGIGVVRAKIGSILDSNHCEIKTDQGKVSGRNGHALDR
jgi:hypothetical protein